MLRPCSMDDMRAILQERTMKFARSGTGVGANYRAVRTSRSRAEFIAKLRIVVEEADESIYWLELTARSKMVDARAVHALRKEASELCAIFSKSLGTVRLNHRSAKTEDGHMAI